MKKTLAGFLLVIVGIAIIVFGMFQALRPVVAMYQEAMTDPMGSEAQHSGQQDVLDSAKDQVPKQMFRGIAIGAIGLVPLLVGSVLIKIAIFQRLRRSKLFAGAQGATPANPNPAPRPVHPRALNPHSGPPGTTRTTAQTLRDDNPFAR